jgi:two-component system response regulator
MTQGTILLVEDSADDADLTMLAFKRAEIPNPVHVAADGAAALDYLFGSAAKAEIPALIVLDLNLPKFSGPEVLRRIRADERTRFIPVVVLSTSIREEDVANSYALGANAYVRKPVAFEEFLATVTKLGVFWLLVNVLPPKTAMPAA